MATSAALQGAEVFVHPSYGRAVRATERLPAGALVLKERPIFVVLPSASAVAEAAKVRSKQLGRVARVFACSKARVCGAALPAL
jgi:hypothetical protein